MVGRDGNVGVVVGKEIRGVIDGVWCGKRRRFSKLRRDRV